jgi:glucose/arabinose dehydrogenase
VGVALSDQGRLRSVVQGPNGNLYVSTDNGGNTDEILRIVPG